MSFYQTSVGKKVVMAVTGFIFFGFVVVHMLGNLQIFLGPEKLNTYAAFLQGLGSLLWVFRSVIIISVIWHIWSATEVTLQSWAARPEGYTVSRYRETTYAARTLRIGGPAIGLFIIYHLLHLTTGHLHTNGPGFEATFTLANGETVVNVYNNIIYGFQIWWISAVYIATMSLVSLHFYHGLWSMLQTIGVNHPKWNKYRRAFALLFALFVAGAGISIPAAVLLGVLQPV